MKDVLIKNYKQAEGVKMAELLEKLGFEDKGFDKIQSGPYEQWPDILIYPSSKMFHCGRLDIEIDPGTIQAQASMMDALGIIIEEYLLKES